MCWNEWSARRLRLRERGGRAARPAALALALLAEGPEKQQQQDDRNGDADQPEESALQHALLPCLRAGALARLVWAVVGVALGRYLPLSASLTPPTAFWTLPFA